MSCSIGTVFRNNTTIVNFNQLRYFESVTQIDSYAFGYCSNLEYVKFPPKLTKIVQRAFIYCTKIRLFDLPATVYSLESACFNNCTFTLIVRRATPFSIGAEALKYNTVIAIYVPDDSVDAYKAYANWSFHASKIKPLSQYTG